MEIVVMRKTRRLHALLPKTTHHASDPVRPSGNGSHHLRVVNTYASIRPKNLAMNHLGDAYLAGIAGNGGDSWTKQLTPAVASKVMRSRSRSEADGLSLVVNLDGDIVHCTPGAARLLKHDRRSLIGASIRDFIPELPIRDGTPGYNLAYAALNFSDQTWQKFALRDQNACAQAIEINVKPLKFNATRGFQILLRHRGNGAGGMDDLAHLIEIDDLRNEAIAILNPEGVIIHANSAYEALTGFTCQEAVGAVPPALKPRFQAPEHYPEFWSALSSGREAHYTCVSRRKNGEWYFAEYAIRPFVDALGNAKHFIARQRDLSSHDHAQGELLQLAYFDALTGLPNRNLFLDRLHQEIARSSRSHIAFTVLFIDVNAFKAVNDTYGHAAGDRLLQELAARLKHCVRDSDTVARLSGDEFAIILSALSIKAHIIEVLNKIKRVVSSEFFLDGVRQPISISIGAAIFPEHGANESALLKSADLAMYEAKRSKALGWCFSDTERASAGCRSAREEGDAP